MINNAVTFHPIELDVLKLEAHRLLFIKPEPGQQIIPAMWISLHPTRDQPNDVFFPTKYFKQHHQDSLIKDLLHFVLMFYTGSGYYGYIRHVN